MVDLTRRGTLGLLGALAVSSTATSARSDEGTPDEPTLNRFATTVLGAEITGLYLTRTNRFFFNVQHPDVNQDGDTEVGRVGALEGAKLSDLPEDFGSLQLPEAEDQRRQVRTAIGDYHTLAFGGDETRTSEEGGSGWRTDEGLGMAYTPDGEPLTSGTDPDFNGFVSTADLQQGDEPTAENYQIDFVKDGVEDALGQDEDDYYGRQNRLIQYAHTENGEVTERDTWLNSLEDSVRRRVDSDPIAVNDGTATVSFTVSEGQPIALSLAVYTLPNGEFGFDTADEQELVDSATGEFGPGEHTLTVSLSGGDAKSDEGSETEGYLFTNWEHLVGGVSRMELTQTDDGTWQVDERMNVDFRDVGGTIRNCFGTVSPWGTPLSSEENSAVPETAEWNDLDGSLGTPLAHYLGYERGDDGLFEQFPNPYRYGYIIEIKRPGSDDPTPVKQFTLGRSVHENAVVMPDEKTAYTTSDGTGRAFFKFVADEAGDLSAGTLYAAKATGDSGDDFNTVGFDLEWIELAHATNARIESWIAEYDDITQHDYAKGETSYITEAEIREWADGEAEDDRVAFLESERAAAAVGATDEWRKMEGINIRRDADVGDYMYVSISSIGETMADDEGDIQLRGNEYGAVYRMQLREGYDVTRMEPAVTGGPQANICGGCPADASPNSSQSVCEDCEFNPRNDPIEKADGVSEKLYAAGTAPLKDMLSDTEADPEDTIANPDNVVVMDDGRVVIGEDTGLHRNNMIWIFNPADDASA